MSGTIDISSGGAIAVDTEVIRALIPRITDAADRLIHAERELQRAASLSSSWGSFSFANEPRPFVIRVVPNEHTRSVLRQRAERMQETAASVRLMADAYDIVESRMRARLERMSGMQFIGEAVPRCVYLNPAALELADQLEREWEKGRAEGFAAQAGMLGPLGLAPWILLKLLPVLVKKYGNSIVPPDRVLKGTPPEVTVDSQIVAEDIIAPVNTEDIVSRLPEGEAQVRVEVYEFADGSTQYFAHIAGTKGFFSDTEPWDFESNLQLYYDWQSASYEAVNQALAAAGAKPGDAVHVNGHSQGAMIGAAVAMEGVFDVRTYVSVGGAVTPMLPDSTLSAQFVHTDDLVAMLAGGGVATGIGAAGSVLVRRVGDPATGVQDLRLATHNPTRYAETAKMFDESGDPRVAQFTERWKELGEATNVRAIDVTATKVVGESTETADEPR